MTHSSDGGRAHPGTRWQPQAPTNLSTFRDSSCYPRITPRKCAAETQRDRFYPQEIPLLPPAFLFRKGSLARCQVVHVSPPPQVRVGYYGAQVTGRPLSLFLFTTWSRLARLCAYTRHRHPWPPQSAGKSGLWNLLERAREITSGRWLATSMSERACSMYPPHRRFTLTRSNMPESVGTTMSLPPAGWWTVTARTRGEVFSLRCPRTTSPVAGPLGSTGNQSQNTCEI